MKNRFKKEKKLFLEKYHIFKWILLLEELNLDSQSENTEFKRKI